MGKKIISKKNFWISCLVIFCSLFLVLGIIFANFYYNNFTRGGSIKKAEKTISEYMIDKYGDGLEVDIVHFEGSHTGNMGNVWHTVVLENNPNIKFDVNLDGFIGEKVVKDDRYEYGLLAYEENNKLEPFLGNIGNFGFSKQEDIMDDTQLKNYIEYEYDYSDTKDYILSMNITYNELDKEDILSNDFIDNLYNLIEVIHKNNIDILTLNIIGKDIDHLYLKLKDLNHIRSKDDLVLGLKNNNEDILSYLDKYKFEAFFRGLENGRFTFANEYSDRWLECEEVSEGECVNYRIHVFYKDDGLRSDNIYLEEDLNLLLFKIDDFLNSEELNLEGFWKKYFLLDMRDETGYHYSFDNNGYNEEDYKQNIRKVLEQIKEDR